MRPSYATPLFLLMIQTSAVYSQQPTIPEIAAVARGETTEVGVHSDGPPRPLVKAIGEADTILRGTVVQLRSALSEDQLQIYTEYELRNVTPIVAPIETSPKPAGLKVVVRQLGGTLTIDGTTVSYVHSALRPLTSGIEVILFLRRSGTSRPGERAYELADMAGAFQVEGERVHALSTVLLEKKSVDGTAVEAFYSRLIQLHQNSATPVK